MSLRIEKERIDVFESDRGRVAEIAIRREEHFDNEPFNDLSEGGTRQLQPTQLVDRRFNLGPVWKKVGLSVP